MIEIKHVSKTYGKHQALCDLSLKIDEKKTVCLIGKMGSGKSTLLRCLAGLVQPDSGEIVFSNGQKPRIGMIFQHFNLFPHLNVLQNLTMAPITVLGMSAKEAKAELVQWFKRFGIESWWNKKVEELSKGMAQKVQFITTVVHKPSLLILDEPSLGLAPLLIKDIFATLLKIKEEGTTILIVEQNALATLKIADYAYVLELGKISMHGKAGDLLKDERLIAAYLGG